MLLRSSRTRRKNEALFRCDKPGSALWTRALSNNLLELKLLSAGFRLTSMRRQIPTRRACVRKAKIIGPCPQPLKTPCFSTRQRHHSRVSLKLSLAQLRFSTALKLQAKAREARQWLWGRRDSPQDFLNSRLHSMVRSKTALWKLKCSPRSSILRQSKILPRSLPRITAIRRQKWRESSGQRVWSKSTCRRTTIRTRYPPARRQPFDVTDL